MCSQPLLFMVTIPTCTPVIGHSLQHGSRLPTQTLFSDAIGDKGADVLRVEIAVGEHQVGISVGEAIKKAVRVDCTFKRGTLLLGPVENVLTDAHAAGSGVVQNVILHGYHASPVQEGVVDLAGSGRFPIDPVEEVIVIVNGHVHHMAVIIENDQFLTVAAIHLCYKDGSEICPIYMAAREREETDRETDRQRPRERERQRQRQRQRETERDREIEREKQTDRVTQALHVQGIIQH